MRGSIRTGCRDPRHPKQGTGMEQHVHHIAAYAVPGAHVHTSVASGSHWKLPMLMYSSGSSADVPAGITLPELPADPDAPASAAHAYARTATSAAMSIDAPVHIGSTSRAPGCLHWQASVNMERHADPGTAVATALLTLATAEVLAHAGEPHLPKPFTDVEMHATARAPALRGVARVNSALPPPLRRHRRNRSRDGVVQLPLAPGQAGKCTTMSTAGRPRGGCSHGTALSCDTIPPVSLLPPAPVRVLWHGDSVPFKSGTWAIVAAELTDSQHAPVEVFASGMAAAKLSLWETAADSVCLDDKDGNGFAPTGAPPPGLQLLACRPAHLPLLLPPASLKLRL